MRFFAVCKTQGELEPGGGSGHFQRHGDQHGEHPSDGHRRADAGVYLRQDLVVVDGIVEHGQPGEWAIDFGWYVHRIQHGD